MQDWQLMRQYTERGSQAAFAQLVERHLKAVYSTCLREVGDPSLAEDVVQVVFLLLAKKARTLPEETVISGWLFHAARFASKDVLKQEARRRVRDRKAVEAMELSQEQARDTWRRIDPLLNEAIGSLHERDRDSIILRFFDGLSFAEAGSVMGISEAAAQMRVTRSLEKIRHFLVRHGIGITGALLITLLAENAARCAPGTSGAIIAARVLEAAHPISPISGSAVPKSTVPGNSLFPSQSYPGPGNHGGVPVNSAQNWGIPGPSPNNPHHPGSIIGGPATYQASAVTRGVRPISEINTMAAHVSESLRLARIKMLFTVAVCVAVVAMLALVCSNIARRTQDQAAAQAGPHHATNLMNLPANQPAGNQHHNFAGSNSQ